MYENNTIGEAIKRNRLLKGLRQAELAKIMGISPAAIGTYERGARRVTVGMAQRIADALEIPIGDLINEEQFEKEEDRHYTQTMNFITWLRSNGFVMSNPINCDEEISIVVDIDRKPYEIGDTMDKIMQMCMDNFISSVKHLGEKV